MEIRGNVKDALAAPSPVSAQWPGQTELPHTVVHPREGML